VVVDDEDGEHETTIAADAGFVGTANPTGHLKPGLRVSTPGRA
jgi:hypothetical protein